MDGKKQNALASYRLEAVERNDFKPFSFLPNHPNNGTAPSPSNRKLHETSIDRSMMQRIKNNLPLALFPDARARKVSIFQRMLALIFGSPNARRGNGIIYSGLDISGKLGRILNRLRGNQANLPVFEIDRIGTAYNEKLPRIWLSEELFNTKHDKSDRVFVECYPAGPDMGGEKALELGDIYLGEGYREMKRDNIAKASECFKASEILYLHASKRGNRESARRLKSMYDMDLCNGDWYRSYLMDHAKHARKGKVRKYFAM